MPVFLTIFIFLHFFLPSDLKCHMVGIIFAAFFEKYTEKLAYIK